MESVYKENMLLSILIINMRHVFYTLSAVSIWYVTLIKGLFNKTLLNYPGKQIALLHIDCDLYEGYLTVLETLYHRVVKGGLILFDEYDVKAFPGAAKAVDCFFDKIDDSDYKFVYDETISKYYVVKTR